MIIFLKAILGKHRISKFEHQKSCTYYSWLANIWIWKQFLELNIENSGFELYQLIYGSWVNKN